MALDSLKLTGLVETGEELSRGSYAVSSTVCWNGLRCSGMRLLATDSDGLESACVTLGNLRHPNVIQFLGVCQCEGDKHPLLVWENLPVSLALSIRHGTLTLDARYSVLLDVARGLAFLHGRSPPFPHGHLSPDNVLLTHGLRAKLAEPGLRRLLGSGASGRDEYEAPEASEGHGCTVESDCYSYGVMALVTLASGSKKAKLVSSGSPALSAVRESVGKSCVLSELIHKCLSAEPGSRPTTAQVLDGVGDALLQYKPHPSPPFLLADAGRGSVGCGALDTEAKRLSASIEAEQLRALVEELKVENKGLRASLVTQQNVLAARDQEMAAKLISKDQEILTKSQELSAKTSSINSCKAAIASKEATVQVLHRQLRRLRGYLSSNNEPHLLSPSVQMKWSQCAFLPKAMVFAQAVAVGSSVYFGSGTTSIGEAKDSTHTMFRYDTETDKWSAVPNCPVVGFGMVEYMGRLVIVGGAYESTNDGGASPYLLTGDTHTFNADSQVWKQCLPAMATARLMPTAMAYKSSIVACGGIVLDQQSDFCISTVEVYHRESGQWHTAEPLPLACIGMSSTIVQDACYLLGGFTDTEFDHPTIHVFSGSLDALLEDTVPSLADEGPAANGLPTASIWQHFTDAPRYASTVASLGGCLLALGGTDENLRHKSKAVHVFSSLNNTWIRMEDIPIECFACAAVRLGSGEVMIVGGMGYDEEDALRTAYKGCLVTSPGEDF